MVNLFEGGAEIIPDGQLYKVDIPESHELLDYDKPLSKQPKQVKAALAKIKDLLPENALADLGEDWNTLFGNDNTGQNLYDTLSSVVGGDKEASLLLNEAGVPGLRYLDGMSRDKGEGSHNYVIFDDAAVDMLKTYYQESADSGPRGGIRKLDDGRSIVGLFKDKDISTVLHEGGHFFLENLREASRLETAPEWVRESWQTVQREYGFTEDSIPREAPERFARDFEAYLREGKAPSPKLETAFAKFRECGHLQKPQTTTGR